MKTYTVRNDSVRRRLNVALRSRVARVVLQALHVPGLRDEIGLQAPFKDPLKSTWVLRRDLGTAPRATSNRIKMLDGKPYVFWTDGSLRHAAGRVKGKANVKAAKRARRWA